jgi:hypothetical protein
VASQGDRESNAEIVSALRALADALTSDVTGLEVETLVAGAQQAERLRDSAPDIAGRLLAELHARGHSWPEISRMTGISQTTVFRRADPFLPPG